MGGWVSVEDDKICTFNTHIDLFAEFFLERVYLPRMKYHN